MKQVLLRWVRQIGWMDGFDRLYFGWNRWRNRSRNAHFRATHPGVALPPDYMLYEAYRLDYEDYYKGGADTASGLVTQWKEHGLMPGAAILEWGCGPARIVRHLPALLPDAAIFGTDYNKNTIEWCRQHIKGVQFDTNELEPPLRYEANRFDLVYAVSIFTHLSEKNHTDWLDELHRIIKPGGLLMFTTQGKAFTAKLSRKEKEVFDKGGLVVRAQVQEGHRSYSAFQPEAFMRALFKDRWREVEFIAGTAQSWGIAQDTWIVQKIKE